MVTETFRLLFLSVGLFVFRCFFVYILTLPYSFLRISSAHFLPVIARIRCFPSCFGLPCYFAGMVISFLFPLSILCECLFFGVVSREISHAADLLRFGP
jgi:hypothetical protein